MTGLEVSYLAAWAVVATLLVVAGGVGYLLAVVAIGCGMHRAHVPVRPERRTRRRSVLSLSPSGRTS